MTSRKSVAELEARYVAEVEARDIQKAIEVLNRAGMEHHIANYILQVEQSNRWALIQRLNDGAEL